MFGHSVRMPVDIMYGSPNQPTTTIPKYVVDLRSSLSAAYKQVRDCMGNKRARQKEFYDRRVHGQLFSPGDLVWLNNLAVPHGRAKKLHCPWTGPYRIIARLSDAVYRIQHIRLCRKRVVVYFDRLKPRSPTTRQPEEGQQAHSQIYTLHPHPLALLLNYCT